MTRRKLVNKPFLSPMKTYNHLITGITGNHWVLRQQTMNYGEQCELSGCKIKESVPTS
jgi:hypothetical protein